MPEARPQAPLGAKAKPAKGALNRAPVLGPRQSVELREQLLEIESRLSSYGFDQHAINAESYVHAREIFVMFESLLSAAQSRRLLLRCYLGR